MKIKITVIDDDGKELEGEIELSPKLGSTKKSSSKPVAKKFVGLHGGINFLISQKFIASPKSAKQITEELKKEGMPQVMKDIFKEIGRR